MADLGALSDHIRQRAEMGRKKYGTYLTANNGRNALVDAYQEVLDMIVYLRQKIADGDIAPRPCDGYATRPEPAPVSQGGERVVDLVALDLECYRPSPRDHDAARLYWMAVGMAESMRLMLEAERGGRGNPL